MNIWTKLLVFFPIWFLFSALFYAVVFLIYPDSYSGSRAEFELLISNNSGFLLISQAALFLATFSAIFFVSNVLDKGKATFLNSMLNPEGFFFGIFLAAIAILLIILILSFTTKIIITFNGFNIKILLYTVVFFLVAISEEAMSRGFIFANLYNHSKSYIAILFSSLIFSLMHAFNSSFNWIGMLNIILAGILFCQLYLKRMNLSIPIGFHFSWNLIQGPMFGFSVSGFVTKGIFKIGSLSGTKFSFDGFGLEGSLISTLIIGIFIVYFFVTNTRKIISSKILKLSATNVTILKPEI